MNILFVSPSTPSRLHRIRALQLLTQLSKTHTVHLVSHAWSEPTQEEKDELGKICASVTFVAEPKWKGTLRALLAVPSATSFEVAYYASSKMREAIKKIITENSIDLVYVKRLRSTEYLPDALQSSSRAIPVILDSTDAMSMFYERAAGHAPFPLSRIYKSEQHRYEKFEKSLAWRFKEWVVCSEIDAAYLRKKFPGIHVTVIPNGVDTNYFHAATEEPEPRTLLISGLLDKFVNYEAAEYFVKKIFPIIQKWCPDVELLLVGPAGKKARSLSGKNIHVTGKVPDLRPYIARASVVCCPVLTGAGTRNKILQAWASGRPIVSTPQGIEGLEHQDGEDVLLAKDPRQFADAVLSLLANNPLREHLVEGGRRRIQETYSMDAIGIPLHKFLDTLILRR